MAVPRIVRVALFLLSGVQGTAVLAQGTILEVIPLRYRQAAEVIPVIQPMLAREGSVSGYQGQLVVRTTPANLEEIKRILAALDTAPRQLLITVREDSALERSRSQADISANVGSDNARVVIPPAGRDPRGGSVVVGEGDDKVRLRALEGSSVQGGSGTQTVRAMEGREAFVRSGQSAPVRERQVQRTMVGGKVVERVVESTQYRDTGSGFYVLPRLAGERVTLDISQQREALLRGASGAASVQGVVTTVSGRMGEWIEIGGIDRDASSQQSALLGRSSAAARDSRRILIKVEEIR
jgi:type II secretory pathway component GspD/PulD (secretin)